MQIFVRDLSGATVSFNASTPSDLLEQVNDRLDLSPASSRLSYRSRQIQSSSSSSFIDYRIPNYATLDLSLRLPGGGPKKRCAYSAPVASGSKTPATIKEAVAPSSVAASSTAAAAAAGEGEGGQAKKETDATVEVAPVAQEPVVERCTSAALRMVGECPRCEKNYCGAHRLPEDHACPALANFRKAAFDENRLKLAKEATHVSKISAF